MKYAILNVFLFVTFVSVAQQRYAKDIREFKKSDSVARPPDNPILFIGSSSFTRWKDIQSAFPRHVILNRGFGGSTLLDLIHYQDDVIFPYAPKQIVIYCGENDIASGATSDEMLSRFDQLFTSIRQRLPEVPIAFISMKPSPSREKFREELKKGNELVRDYLKDKKRTQYIDIYSLMLNKQDKPQPELYVSDSLHMSENGYKIWRKAIQPVLIR